MDGTADWQLSKKLMSGRREPSNSRGKNQKSLTSMEETQMTYQTDEQKGKRKKHKKWHHLYCRTGD